MYLAILEKCNIDENVFLRMVAESDAVRAVKALLRPGAVQVAFRGLRRRGRADLSVEHLVIQPHWHDLFTDAEMKTAKSRLQRNTPRKADKSHSCEAKAECPLYRSRVS